MSGVLQVLIVITLVLAIIGVVAYLFTFKRNRMKRIRQKGVSSANVQTTRIADSGRPISKSKISAAIHKTEKSSPMFGGKKPIYDDKPNDKVDYDKWRETKQNMEKEKVFSYKTVGSQVVLEEKEEMVVKPISKEEGYKMPKHFKSKKSFFGKKDKKGKDIIPKTNPLEDESEPFGLLSGMNERTLKDDEAEETVHISSEKREQKSKTKKVEEKAVITEEHPREVIDNINILDVEDDDEPEDINDEIIVRHYEPYAYKPSEDEEEEETVIIDDIDSDVTIEKRLEYLTGDKKDVYLTKPHKPKKK